MSRRPRKLHFAVTHVVKASGVLTPIEKLVWLEDWAMDNGPEASWISVTELARRLATDVGTIQTCRQWFAHAGLQVAVRGANGREGFICTMPHDACIPPSQRPSRGLVFGCAAQLDSLLGDAQMGAKPKSDSRESEISFARNRNQIRDSAAVAPTSSNLVVDSEKPFQPVVRSEVGTVARNGEQQVGDRPANPDSGGNGIQNGETEEQRWERLRETRRAQFRVASS